MNWMIYILLHFREYRENNPKYLYSVQCLFICLKNWGNRIKLWYYFSSKIIINHYYKLSFASFVGKLEDIYFVPFSISQIQEKNKLLSCFQRCFISFCWAVVYSSFCSCDDIYFGLFLQPTPLRPKYMYAVT